MTRIGSELKTNRSVINPCFLLRHAGLVCTLVLASAAARGQDVAWPQFRGPESNPVGKHAKLADQLVENRKRRMVARDSRARMVIAHRYRRQGVRDHRDH